MTFMVATAYKLQAYYTVQLHCCWSLHNRGYPVADKHKLTVYHNKCIVENLSESKNINDLEIEKHGVLTNFSPLHAALHI